jgi:hypothetical protein
MSSVAKFVASTSVWHEVTPALDRVTRHCNLHSTTYTGQILRAGAPGGAAITAETAFRLAALGERDIDDAIIQRALEESAAFLHQTPPATGSIIMREVEELRQNLLAFFEPADEYEFFPTIPGAGVIDATTADVRRGSSLYEVKTVTRGWNSTDLRQCLTYAAMLYSVGDRLSKIALVNPRAGRVIMLSLAEIAVGAGADSASALLNGLVYRMVALNVSA